MRILLLKDFRYWVAGDTLTVDKELGDQLIATGVAKLSDTYSSTEKMFKFLAQNQGVFPSRKENSLEEE